MFNRGLRRIGVAVFILATISFPAQARERESGRRDIQRLEVRGFLGHFQNALRGLLAFARGGMDPNGES